MEPANIAFLSLSPRSAEPSHSNLRSVATILSAVEQLGRGVDRRTHDTANACIVIYWGDNTVDNGLFRERSTYSFIPSSTEAKMSQFSMGWNPFWAWVYGGIDP